MPSEIVVTSSEKIVAVVLFLHGDNVVHGTTNFSTLPAPTKIETLQTLPTARALNASAS